MTAVIDAGFTVELLHELDHTLFPRWPFLERRGDGSTTSPTGMPSIPLMYSPGPPVRLSRAGHSPAASVTTDAPTSTDRDRPDTCRDRLTGSTHVPYVYALRPRHRARRWT